MELVAARALSLPGWGGGQDLGEERHALHRSHGDVERPCDVHGHGGGDGHRVGDVHVAGGGRDVDRGDVDGTSDGDGVLEAHGRGDVDRAGAKAHGSTDSDRI